MMNNTNGDSAEEPKKGFNIEDIDLYPVKIVSQKETWVPNLKKLYPSKRPNIIANCSGDKGSNVEVICINKKNFEKFQESVSEEIKKLEEKLEELEKRKLAETRKIKMLYKSDFLPNKKFEADARVVRMHGKGVGPSSVLIEMEKFEELDAALREIIEKTGKLNFVNTLNETYIMNFKNRWYRKRFVLDLVTNEKNECFVMVPIAELQKLENELSDVFEKVEDEMRMATLIARKNDLFNVRETERMQEERIKIKRELAELEWEKEKFSKDKMEFSEILKKFKEVSFLLSDTGLKTVQENINNMKKQVLTSLDNLDNLESLFKQNKIDGDSLSQCEREYDAKKDIKSLVGKKFLQGDRAMEEDTESDGFLGLISLMEKYKSSIND